MILKYELPPLGCAALGAPSLDGGGSPIEIGYFNIPEVEQFTPSRPRTFPFSTGFGYIESRVKLAMSDPLPPLYFYRQTHNQLRILLFHLNHKYP